LIVIERPADKPEQLSATDDQGTQWLIGDRNYIDFASSSDLPSGSPRARILSKERMNGRWISIRLDAQTGNLQLSSDRLGLIWLYIAKTPSGVIFSTDFGALARELKGQLSIDRDTLLLELALGYTPDDSTIFNEIKLAPPGQTIEITSAGFSVIEKNSTEYGDRYAGLSQEGKFARLDDIYARIADSWCRHVGTRMVLSISAGYDSRYALALLDERSSVPPLCTFGDPESDEVRGARAVVAKIGRETDLFRVSAADWQQWQRCIQSLGNAGMTQWSGWAETWLSFLRDHGEFPIIGYLGDALSGKHLGRQISPPDWLDQWTRWSTKGGWAESDLLNATVRRKLREVMAERFKSCLDQVHLAFPYQRALHLDLFGRQRRWVASQPNLVSRFSTPLLLFYDEDLIDFWMNLPPEDLVGQRLYLSYAQERFPRLFPKNKRAAPTLTERVMRKMRRIVEGTDKKIPPAVIDHRVIIESNRQQIIKLADDTAPLLAEVLDMPRFIESVRSYSGRSDDLASGLIMRCVNVMLLIRLSIE
jgi:hypothetical protein